MRDLKRIPIILKRIEAIWLKYPDLRLGQIINNAIHFTDVKPKPSVSDRIYYIEDEELVTTIENWLGENK